VPDGQKKGNQIAPDFLLEIVRIWAVRRPKGRIGASLESLGDFGQSRGKGGGKLEKTKCGNAHDEGRG